MGKLVQAGSAQQLADELARYLNDEPILAQPISRPSRVGRWCRRKLVVAALALAVVVTMLAGTVISSFFATQANQRAVAELTARRAAEVQRDEARRTRDRESAARNEAEIARQREEALRLQASRLAEERRNRLYATRIQLVQREFQAANVQHAMELLDSQIPQPGQDDLRGFEWYYLWRLCRGRRNLKKANEHTVAPRSREFMCAFQDGRYCGLPTR